MIRRNRNEHFFTHIIICTSGSQSLQSGGSVLSNTASSARMSGPHIENTVLGALASYDNVPPKGKFDFSTVDKICEVLSN